MKICVLMSPPSSSYLQQSSISYRVYQRLTPQLNLLSKTRNLDGRWREFLFLEL